MDADRDTRSKSPVGHTNGSTAAQAAIVNGAAAIRVLVAEDNNLTRLGTVTLLGAVAGIRVVGEAENGIQALELYKKLKPDVLVSDMRMPHLDGLQVLSGVLAHDPRARVLMLSHYDGREEIFRAMKTGAAGYMTKDIRGEELIEAIRTVHGGELYVPEHIRTRLDERERQPQLSPREHQVLEKIYEGGRNVDIAKDLRISEKTVISYVSSLLSKLSVKSRTEAIRVAQERGLLVRRDP